MFISFVSLITGAVPLVVLLSSSENFTTAREIERNLRLQNESGRRVTVHWVHPNTGELVLQSTPHVFNGATFALNSYAGHQFRVTELPGKTSGNCGDYNENIGCRTADFVVSNNEDQVFVVHKGIDIEIIDNVAIAHKKAAKIISGCENESKNSEKKLDADSALSDRTTQALDDFMVCVGSTFKETHDGLTEEIAFQTSTRRQMSDLVKKYACDDRVLPMSTPVETKNWSKMGLRKEVNVLYDTLSSKIHYIKNFITHEECAEIDRITEKNAMAIDDDEVEGLSLKTNQKITKMIIPQKNRNVLRRRVIDYTNYATLLDIRRLDSKEWMIMHEFGTNEDIGEPSNFTSHCDEGCRGLPHNPGGRAASISMYCNVPEEGGTINFVNAGVHIIPEKGSAIFFSYMSHEYGVMDKGFTHYIGCPAITGDMKVIMQHVSLDES